MVTALRTLSNILFICYWSIADGFDPLLEQPKWKTIIKMMYWYKFHF